VIGAKKSGALDEARANPAPHLGSTARDKLRKLRAAARQIVSAVQRSARPRPDRPVAHC